MTSWTLDLVLAVYFFVSCFANFTAQCYAESGNSMASCPSVCLSVMLRYHSHKDWNSWKIISWQIRLTFPPSADPKNGTPQILAGIGVGYGKIGSGHTKLAISQKWLRYNESYY